MKKINPYFIFPTLILSIFLSILTFSFGAETSANEPGPRALSDVMKNARRREKVLVEGKIVRPFDFDTFLLSDGKEELAVSFAGLRQDLAAGDQVVIYGRFDGRSSYLARYGLLHVLTYAKSMDPKSTELRAKYGVSPEEVEALPPQVTTAPAASKRSVENRLRELDDLNSKGLVTPEEYKEQRRRILNDL